MHQIRVECRSTPPQRYGNPQKGSAEGDVVSGAIGDARGSVVGGAIGDPGGSAIGDAKGGAIGGAVGGVVGGTLGSQRRRRHFRRCRTQNGIHYNSVIFWSVLNLLKGLS